MITQQALDRLKKLKITAERYQKDHSQLARLGFSQEQADKIILRISSKNTVKALLTYTAELLSPKFGFDHSMITAIAAHNGGSNNLKTTFELTAKLKILGFAITDIKAIAAHDGGSKNLQETYELTKALQERGFAIRDIKAIAANNGGSKNLQETYERTTALQKLGFSISDIKAIAANIGGSKNLQETYERTKVLQELGFAISDIKAIAANIGGSKNLQETYELTKALQKLGFAITDIKTIAAHNGGSKNLQETYERTTALQELGFAISDIKAIAARPGGSQKLRVLINHSPLLIKELQLSITEITFLAIHGGRVLVSTIATQEGKRKRLELADKPSSNKPIFDDCFGIEPFPIDEFEIQERSLAPRGIDIDEELIQAFINELAAIEPADNNPISIDTTRTKNASPLAAAGLFSGSTKNNKRPLEYRSSTTNRELYQSAFL